MAPRRETGDLSPKDNYPESKVVHHQYGEKRLITVYRATRAQTYFCARAKAFFDHFVTSTCDAGTERLVDSIDCLFQDVCQAASGALSVFMQSALEFPDWSSWLDSKGKDVVTQRLTEWINLRGSECDGEEESNESETRWVNKLFSMLELDKVRGGWRREGRALSIRMKGGPVRVCW